MIPFLVFHWLSRSSGGEDNEIPEMTRGQLACIVIGLLIGLVFLGAVIDEGLSHGAEARRFVDMVDRGTGIPPSLQDTSPAATRWLAIQKIPQELKADCDVSFDNGATWVRKRRFCEPLGIEWHRSGSWKSSECWSNGGSEETGRMTCGDFISNPTWIIGEDYWFRRHGTP